MARAVQKPLRKSRKRNTPGPTTVKVRIKITFGRAEQELKESKVLLEFDCTTGKTRSLLTTKSYRNGAQDIIGKFGRWKELGSDPSYSALRGIICPG